MERKALEDDDIDRITQMREFDYIGYKFSIGQIGLSSRRIGKIKARVPKLFTFTSCYI